MGTQPDSTSSRTKIQEPVVVRFASAIGVCGLVATLAVAMAGIPGPIHGFVWRTSHDAAAYNITVKLAASVGALFVAVLALGRFELGRNAGRQAASALDHSTQTLDHAEQIHCEGQLSRAVTQLGSDNEIVQSSAIYSLAALYHEPKATDKVKSLIVRDLCAFVRRIHPSADGVTAPRRAGSALAAAISVLRELQDRPSDRIRSPGAGLDGVSLDNTHMCVSDLGSASVRDATLTCVDLRWSNLRACDLTGSDLSAATFDWCNLTDADLAGATAIGASFRDTVLTRANLLGADLTEADFSRATWDADGPPSWPDGFVAPVRGPSKLIWQQLGEIRREVSGGDADLWNEGALRRSGTANITKWRIVAQRTRMPGRLSSEAEQSPMRIEAGQPSQRSKSVAIRRWATIRRHGR